MRVQGALPPEASSFWTEHWLKPCYFGTILQNQCQILGGTPIFPSPLSKYRGGGTPPSPPLPPFLRPWKYKIPLYFSVWFPCMNYINSRCVFLPCWVLYPVSIQVFGEHFGVKSSRLDSESYCCNKQKINISVKIYLCNVCYPNLYCWQNFTENTKPSFSQFHVFLWI